MTTKNLILRLGVCGTPIRWVTPEKAATLMVKKQVVWTLGEHNIVLTGGQDRTGHTSQLAVPPIVATKKAAKVADFSPALDNRFLFRRDRYVCLYCGKRFAARDLSRDHVFPRARGGLDVWENVVTACKPCNQAKACRTPEEAGMPLLAIPYKPNVFEFALLANHRVLVGQMAFLSKGVSLNFRMP